MAVGIVMTVNVAATKIISIALAVARRQKMELVLRGRHQLPEKEKWF